MIGTPGRTDELHVLRLQPGEDVRRMLEEWCDEHSVQAAAVVSAVGSLRQAMIRYGGQDDAGMLTGDLEVCALNGTLSIHGLHIHLTVADGSGRMSGGHLCTGCIVRTTLELVIMIIADVRMLRRKDDATGYNELCTEPVGQ